ncbi:hypothetical protein DL765_005715 [Monosporascus sp. GIB2]|nr:hypothetical protein DL765_005715 [Monosporascus sp. GIB2]
MLSLLVASIISGGVTTKVGYYVPAMILSPSLLSLGQGLMSMFRVGETPAHWIGYQVIASFRLSCGMQSARLEAQAVLPKPDIPTGITIIFFPQRLGGAILPSVGRNLLGTRMTSQIGHTMPGTEDGAITRIFLCSMGVALCGVRRGSVHGVEEHPEYGV